MGRHSRPADIVTAIAETRLVELRRDAKGGRERGPFVDPAIIHACERVLDRRGETWAGSILGRDISRRSIAVPHRPYLLAGEDRVLIAADAEEDLVAINRLEPDSQIR